MIPYAGLLLLLASTALDGVLGAAPGIDWTECKTEETYCVVLATCVIPDAEVTELYDYPKSIKKLTECHIGLLIRPFTDKIWLARLQVTAPLDPAEGIHIYSGTVQKFGCSLTAEAKVVPGSESTLNAELYGEDNSLAASGGFCTFLTKDASTLQGLADKLIIQYTKEGGSKTDLTGPASATVFTTVNTLIGCNPFDLVPKQPAVPAGYEAMPLTTNILAKTFDCKHNGQGSKLFAGPRNAPKPVAKIVCEKAEKTFKYSEIEAGPATPFNKEDDVAFCAILISTTCNDLVPAEGKPEMKAGTEGEKTLVCKNLNFPMLINGDFHHKGAIECKEGPVKGQGVWKVGRKGGGADVLVATAVCIEKLFCNLTASIKGTEDLAIANISSARKESGKISCPSGLHLQVRQSIYDEPLTPTAITCDDSRGIYTMEGTLGDIKDGSHVYCAGDAVSASVRSGAPSAASVGSARWLMPALALLLVIGGLVVLFVVLRRSERKWEPSPKSSGIGTDMPPSGTTRPGPKAPGPGRRRRRRRRRRTPVSDRESARSMRADKANHELGPADDTGAWDPWNFCRGTSPKTPPKPVETPAEKKKEGVKNESEHPDEGTKEEKKKKIAKPPPPLELYTDEGKKKWAKLSIRKKRYFIRWMIKRHGSKTPYNRRKFSLHEFMELVDLMFKTETHPLVWRQLLPFLFFLERTLYHCDQTNDHTVHEIKKTIPGYCYQHFRLYLLTHAEHWLKEYKDVKQQNEHDHIGFIRGIAFLLLYKLNLHDKEAKEAVVDRVYNIFSSDTPDKAMMNLPDASRMVIWGILRHEDNPTKRKHGQYDLFEVPTGGALMYRFLLEEFNELLKKPLVKRPPEGSKMQHLLFALGCGLERHPAIYDLWKTIQNDLRFTPADYMYVMYGRDWLWDGAWVAFCQDPPEHMPFCERFGQECDEYRELAQMCVGYWADWHSEDVKDGNYSFEGLMHAYNPSFDGRFLQKHYDRIYGIWKSRSKHGKDMNGWLKLNDERTIEGYTPTGQVLVELAKNKKPTADAIEEEKLANQHIPKGGGVAAAGAAGAAALPSSSGSSGDKKTK